MRESQLERKTRLAVERIGGKMPKWVSPGNRGVPDRLAILPNGQTVYVELKAPGKPLEPLQRKWRKDLMAMGHLHYKIDCEADIERFIQEVMAK